MFSKYDSLAEQALCANIVALDCIVDRAWKHYKKNFEVIIPAEEYETLTEPELNYIVNELRRRIEYYGGNV